MPNRDGAIAERSESRPTHVGRILADALLDRESELFDRVYEELPRLPVDDLDPLVVSDDASAFLLAPSITGTPDPGELGIARIPNTMEPGTLLVSEPVVPELEAKENVTAGELRPIEFRDGTLPQDSY